MEIKTFTGQRRSGLTHTVLTRARAAGPFVLVVTQDDDDYARFGPAAMVTTLGRHRIGVEGRVAKALRAGAKLVVIDDAHTFGRAYVMRILPLITDYGATLWIAGKPPTKPDHWFARIAEKYPPEVIGGPRQERHYEEVLLDGRRLTGAEHREAEKTGDDRQPSTWVVEFKRAAGG